MSAVAVSRRPDAGHPGPRWPTGSRGARPSPAPSPAAPLRGDVLVYAGSAVVAAGLCLTSTLVTHRIWGGLAMTGYAAAAAVAIAQLVTVHAHARRAAGPSARTAVAGWPWACAAAATGAAARAAVAAVACLATAALPLLLLVTGRAGGRAGLAQDEVRVVEEAGRRLLDTGTPYLSRAAIASLPAGDRLTAYLPYGPGMALFGVPRALDPAPDWWSDARIWFAVAAVAALGGALAVVRGAEVGARLRAVQAAAIAPPVALAVAVGGDDVPVLALCLLALALVARSRYGGAGLAAGAACALKLVAWPVTLALLAHAAARGRARLARFGWGVVGTAAPALLVTGVVDLPAVLENTVHFPLGAGLVGSPATTPLPGYLAATRLPGGQLVAVGLLLVAGLAAGGWLLCRPPPTAAAAAAASGYGLLLALVLMPATRYGYLLYPLALLAWVPALRPAAGPTAGPAAGPATRAATRRYRGPDRRPGQAAGGAGAGCPTSSTGQRR